MANKGTILFIGNHFQSANSSTYIWQELPDRLEALGWDTIVTSKILPRATRLLDMLWTILSKRGVYDIAEIDVFSGLAFMFAELSVLCLKCVNKPIILILHGGNLPVFAQKFPNRVRRVLYAADAVVAPSAFLKVHLKHIRKDIQIIPNPIDISAYPFRHRVNPQPTFVWVRAFHEIYNPSLAPKLLNALLKSWPDAHLTMVGPDKGDSSLRRMLQLASRLGVRDHITLTGGVPRQEVPSWLDKGDIFVNTTNFDNTPVSVVEAMACGLCIVTTDVGGIPYLAEHEQDALLVPPDDPPAMAAAIKRLLTEPCLGSKLSKNARSKSTKFDWSAILPKWEELFAEVMNNQNG